ncbi:hypothetical protein [Pseudomonas fluorescens]|uniref:hypothetical protein n=1 Tax=Pseudomonas fluorescens TaxID=294 RepID=UPI003D1C25B2
MNVVFSIFHTHIWFQREFKDLCFEWSVSDEYLHVTMWLSAKCWTVEPRFSSVDLVSGRPLHFTVILKWEEPGVVSADEILDTFVTVRNRFKRIEDGWLVSAGYLESSTAIRLEDYLKGIAYES